MLYIPWDHLSKELCLLCEYGLHSATKHPYNSLQLGKLRHGAVKT